MVMLTGLPASELDWDTDAYLAQCRALMEKELSGEGGVFGLTHPEHNLRTFAVWLFSETDRYKELTGRGLGSRKIEGVDDCARSPRHSICPISSEPTWKARWRGRIPSNPVQ